MLGIFLTLLSTNAEKKRFNYLYSKNKSTLYNYAYQILEDIHLSEDAVNEAFFSLSRNMNKIKDRSDTDARNYLIVIVKNSARRMLRAQNNIIYVDEIDDMECDTEDIELEISSRELQDRMLQRVKSMDEKYSDVLVLRYYYELTNAEIAKELGLTLENVKIRLHRARKTLREEFEKDGLYSG